MPINCWRQWQRYLRGVAPDGVTTGDICRGVAPFVVLQLMLPGLLAAMPGLDLAAAVVVLKQKNQP